MRDSFWDQFGWADSEERNIDQLPEFPELLFPCPECGSVWVELLAHGFIAPHARIGHVSAHCEDGPLIRYDVPMGLALGRAVRIRCAAGHDCEWDQITGNKRVLPIFRGGILKVSIKVRGFEMPSGWSEFLREHEPK